MNEDSVPVARILDRVPVRAQAVYRLLARHAETRHDEVTGWSYAYLPQSEVARLTGLALRTVTRAVADLRAVGVLRVVAWPGAVTETQIRRAPVATGLSPFGPVRAAELRENPDVVGRAISRLLMEYHFFLWDLELAQDDAGRVI